MPASIVQEQVGSLADRADEQVEVAIAIDVGEHRAGGIQIRTSHARTIGDVREAPVAQVSVKHVGAIQATEIQIHHSVSVHVAGGHTRSIEQDLVRKVPLLREKISERYPGYLGRDRREAGLPGRELQRNVCGGWLRAKTNDGGEDCDEGERQKAAVQP
jgi:hypothetical protein